MLLKHGRKFWLIVNSSHFPALSAEKGNSCFPYSCAIFSDSGFACLPYFIVLLLFFFFVWCWLCSLCALRMNLLLCTACARWSCFWTLAWPLIISTVALLLVAVYYLLPFSRYAVLTSFVSKEVLIRKFRLSATWCCACARILVGLENYHWKLPDLC